MEVLAQIESKYPSLSGKIKEIEDLYSKKLWHNLTDKLEELVFSKELERQANDLSLLYDNFITKFELRTNALKLALIVVSISHSFTDAKKAIDFLQSVKDKLQKDKKQEKQKNEGTIILDIHIALWHLRDQDSSACKKTLQKAKDDIESEGYVDNLVNSAYYKVKSEYLKRNEELNEFFRHSLLYLAYTPIESIPLIQQQAIAFDIGIAALLGDKVYNFGELLAHPVVESLQDTQAEWLLRMLYAFNKGDIHLYKQLVQQYKNQLEQRPIIQKQTKFLEEKIQLMCIMELVFQRSGGDRVIPFSEIASATGKRLDQVEFLLLKALSYNLIKGTIDQVSQNIQVTWVQPRVLDKSQIGNVKSKIGDWLEKVDSTIKYLEQEGGI